MPKRVLRDGILTSEPVNSLSWAAEVFYRRLHSVVDDFGRFSAHPSLLRAACYALRLNDVSDQDVDAWLAVCANCGLVRVYEVEGKRFLEVTKFDQRVRADKSKCPPPPAASGSDPPHSAASVRSPPTNAPVGEGEGEGEGEGGDGGGRKRRRLPATVCPESFDVNEAMSEWAIKQGLPGQRVIPETEKFLDHYRSRGQLQHDWVATWRNWIRKAVEFGEKR